MKIGITYDLYDDYIARGFSPEEAAEFDRADTIDAIDQALRGLGYETVKIGHVMNLAERLVAGERWDLVFNIAEGLDGMGREAQVPALLDAYGIPYTFSDPLVLCLTLHKGMAKRVVRDLGLPTPGFAIVETVADAAGLDFSFPAFAKPVAEGTSKGVSSASKISTKTELVEICGRLLAEFNQPVLVEEYLPGREFTVGILGTGEKARAIGVMEVLVTGSSEQGIYSFHGKKTFEQNVEYRLAGDAVAERAAAIAVRVWRGLGCRDGGRVDLKIDAGGVPSFMEVNPLAGLNPEISDLCILCGLKGISYRELIGSIVESALERIAAKSDSNRVFALAGGPKSVQARVAGAAL